MKRVFCGFLLLCGMLASLPAEATSPLRRPGDPPVVLSLPKREWPEKAARHIPILALYTPERLTALGSFAALKAQLDEELFALNESLRASGLFDYDFVFSAIQAAERHDSGNLYADLEWLQAAWPSGRVTGAGAKLVHLFVSSARDVAGLSPLGPVTGGPSISVVPEGAEVGVFVLAHEIGHSLGLNHDPDNLGPGQPGRWTNSLAFRMAGYRDVMAYSNGCAARFGADCPLFAGFSDPARIRRGVPSGIPRVSEAVTVLRETLPYLAGDRTCFPSETELCLNGRFKVYTVWTTRDLQTSSSYAIPRTEDSGEFWFFNAANIEVIVKVLDGCALNGHYWVFAAGLSDVAVLVSVTDSVTGELRIYNNPLGVPFRPIQDTRAFPCN